MKQTITFPEWMALLDEIAASKGFEGWEIPLEDRADWAMAHWRGLYEKGYTPQQAWDNS